ncbi:MAG: DMT family transporter [Bacteriovoracaceae bacterium]|jgi:drug/metabolite transporter (DMT)-like permease|nr:DMT family transporter [Bacteriovoracaceae bacterium]
MDNKIYFYAVAANLFFAVGSQVYTNYSRKFSPSWMNFVKATIALFAFGLTLTILQQWHEIPLKYICLLLLSGAIGLGVGDIFLLKAFSDMGPGRTLIIFGFQPLILGGFGYLLFDQEMDMQKLSAIFFFILCLATFSIESFKKSGSWQMAGICIAGVGMTLDACGVVMTRYIFDHAPSLVAMEGNFYRCLGAVTIYLMISYFSPIHVLERFKSLDLKGRSIVLIGCLFGTYLSLMFYLMAVKEAHLASLSGIAITGTIFSNAFECIVNKKLPSRYLILSFIFFLMGMKILIF